MLCTYLLLLVIVSSLCDVVAPYDVGCLYPPRMLEPFAARSKILGFTGVYAGTSGTNSPGNSGAVLETPVAVHQGQAFSYCDVNCLAHHDSLVKNGITLERPRIVVPSFGHNPWSRMLCVAQCYSILFANEGNEAALETIKDVWGLRVRSGVENEIADNFETNHEALVDYVTANDFDPLLVGRLVAHEIALHTKKDGWNADGSLRYDPATGRTVPCTANCVPYRDTTGYVVKNHPGSAFPLLETNTDDDENNNNDNNKEWTLDDPFTVNGTDAKWQPLMEDDGKGSIVRQEHVTPHIGFTAKHKLRDPASTDDLLANPDYDFHAESLRVLERLRNAATDTTKRDQISFYDKKFLVRLLIQESVRKQFGADERHTFEDELLFTHGISAAEHDAVLHAWRQKVRFDVVRPTTVVRTFFGGRGLAATTFNGDRDDPKVEELQTRDFQAFLRVMPHSEYPSGSSCICEAYREFVDAWTTNESDGEKLTDMYWGYGGVDFGCDERSLLDPSRNAFLGCKHGGFSVANTAELSEICGESRLWGGMHFTASVKAGRDLCAGLGRLGYDRAVDVRNGSDYGATAAGYAGVGKRPVCASGTTGPTSTPSAATTTTTTTTRTTTSPTAVVRSTGTTAGTAEDDGSGTPDSSMRWLVIAGLCVAVALLVVATFVFFRGRNKK